MTALYMGHRNERTAKLRKLYDTLPRDKALDAAEKLGYTRGGAASWFSDWKKLAPAPAPEKPARKAKAAKAAKPAKARKPKAKLAA